MNTSKRDIEKTLCRGLAMGKARPLGIFWPRGMPKKKDIRPAIFGHAFVS